MKKAIIISSVALASAGAAAGVTVAIVNGVKNKPKYDMGIVVPTVSSLNYIKYESAKNVIGSVVPPLAVSRPMSDSDINSVIRKNPVLFSSDGLGVVSTNSTSVLKPFDSFNIASFKTDSYFSKEAFDSNKINSSIRLKTNSPSRKIDALNITIDKNMKWSNGESISASSYIDYVDYVLDVNVQSTLISEIVSTGISGLSQYVSAQKDYIAAIGRSYIDPAGTITSKPGEKTVKTWPSQNTGDATYVQKIKDAYYNIGLSGDEYSSRPYKESTFNTNIVAKYDDGNRYSTSKDITVKAKAVENVMTKDYLDTLGETKNDKLTRDSLLFIAISKNRQPSGQGRKSYSGFVYQMFTKLLPVSKKYVDSLGQQKFGNSKEHLLTFGPYNIDTAILGDNGSITLERNNSFQYANDTFTDKVKLYFSSNPNVNFSLYRDEDIITTPVPNIMLANLMSDPNFRKDISKTSTNITSGISLNLDKDSRQEYKDGEDPLQYSSFRKSLFFAIDREQLLKISQQDASLVKSNYSSTSLTIDNIGNIYSNALSTDNSLKTSPDTLYTDGENTINTHMSFDNSIKDEVPVRQSSILERYSVDYKTEALDREDRVHNIENAKFFYNKFLKEYRAKTGHDFSSFEMKYIYGDGKVGEDVGVSLDNQLKEVFVGAVSLDIKGLPMNVYENYVRTGKFDIHLGTLIGPGVNNEVSPAFYIQNFFVKDTQSTGEGFFVNPSGGWTFNEYFESLTPSDEDDLIKRLHIHKTDFDIMKELVKPTTFEKEAYKQYGYLEQYNEMKERVNSFLLGKDYWQGGSKVVYQSFTPDYKNRQKLANLLAQFDKIILEDAPVLPVTIEGQGWSISSVSSSMYSDTILTVQWTYDTRKPPKVSLANFSKG